MADESIDRRLQPASRVSLATICHEMKADICVRDCMEYVWDAGALIKPLSPSTGMYLPLYRPTEII